MTAPRFRIVIVAYNSAAVLDATLAGLAAQEGAPEFEAVVVDNACPQGSGRKAALPDGRFSVLALPNNTGFAGGSNAGACGAEAEWLVMLNPDAVPEPGWLAAIDAATRSYDADMFGSTQLSPDGRVDGFGDVMSAFGLFWRGGEGAPASALPNGDRRVLTPCAAASVYRRSAFEAVGGFDETFFCYLEDVDLGLRLRGHGSDCVQLRDAVVVHSGGSSLPEGSDFARRQSQRNTPRLLFKNVPWPVFPLVLFLAVGTRIYLDMRARQTGQGVMGTFWPALRDVGALVHARRSTKRAPWSRLAPYVSWRRREANTQPMRTLPLKD